MAALGALHGVEAAPLAPTAAHVGCATQPSLAGTRFYTWDCEVGPDLPVARLLLVDRDGAPLLALQQCREQLAEEDSRRAFKLAIDKGGGGVVEATPLELSYLKVHAGFAPKAAAASLASPDAVEMALHLRHHLTVDMQRSFAILREQGTAVLQELPPLRHGAGAAMPRPCLQTEQRRR